MKQLSLHNGMFTLVDDEDFESLSKYHWLAKKNSSSHRWYAKRIEDGIVISLHRQIMGDPEGLIVGFKDGDTLNNQRYNLSICTREQLHATTSINHIERFEEKIFYSPDGCWYWTGARSDLGYGNICVNGKTVLSHRFSYSLYKGEIPKGKVIRHKCDNPICQNPDHLIIGTMKDNSRDMINRKRQCNGEKRSDVLTEQQVLEIRLIRSTTTMSLKKIGNMFGVCMGTIWHIVNRVTWTHI